MADLSEALASFLSEAGHTRFAWGRFDCCLWLADWVLAVRGVDGAAALRGRYRTALGCARLLTHLGGVTATVGHCAALAGLSETKRPRTGDIGVVKMMTAKGEREVGAIRTARRWAILTIGGLSSVPAKPLAAWRV